MRHSVIIVIYMKPEYAKETLIKIGWIVLSAIITYFIYHYLTIFFSYK